MPMLYICAYLDVSVGLLIPTAPRIHCNSLSKAATTPICCGHSPKTLFAKNFTNSNNAIRIEDGLNYYKIRHIHDALQAQLYLMPCVIHQL